MKKNLFMLIVVVALLVGVVGCVFAVKNKPTTPKEDPNGKQVTSVQGVAFTIPRSISNQATAITQVADNLAFSDSAYYTYKNGTDEYMLFNISKLVVLAQKNTKFNFSEQEDKEAALEKSGIMGAWFEKSGKKFSCEHSGSKTTAIVNAGVSITSNVYGDFTGKMATIEEDGEEWSIFAGVPGNKYADLNNDVKGALDDIVGSFEISNTPVVETQTYEIVLSGNEANEFGSDISMTVSGEDLASASDAEVSEKSVSDNDTLSDNDTVSGDKAVSGNETAEEITITEVETISANAQDSVSDDSISSDNIPEDDVSSDSVSLDTVSENQIKESEPTPEDNKTPFTRSNQKEVTDRKDEKAYSSDIYSMLKIPCNGILDAVSSKGEIEKVVIRVNKVLPKEKTEKVIRDYCNKKECDYNYFDAPEGCHWEAVSYDLLYQKPDVRPYVNIRLRGADGENLKYRGVKYSPKTHDIFTGTGKEETADGVWIRNNICYYAVPNGCKEYVLECGDGKVDSAYAVASAYYLVN